MAKETTTIGKIYSTTNYDMFKTILGNRPIVTKGTRYFELKKSIEQDGQIVPAIVNEKNEIVDGQHRLVVCKELGIPFIYIVINGAGFVDIAKVNNAKNWSVSVFVNGYATSGIANTEGYRYLKALFDEFSHDVSKSTLQKLAATIGTSTNRQIRDGRFTMTAHTYESVANCLRNLLALGYGDFIKENRRIGQAYWLTMCYLWRHPDVKVDRMIKLMWQNEKRIPATTKVKEYLVVLSNIYNKGVTKENRVYLDRDYDQGLYRKW